MNEDNPLQKGCYVRIKSTNNTRRHHGLNASMREMLNQIVIVDSIFSSSSVEIRDCVWHIADLEEVDQDEVFKDNDAMPHQEIFFNPEELR